MKKVVPVLILFVILIGLGGVVAYTKYIKPMQQISIQVKPTPTKPANMFSSIKDALSKSFSLKCAYTDNANRTAQVYIKAGNIRTDIQNSSSAAEVDSVILKENKMYVWSNNRAQGTVVEFSIAQDAGTASGTTMNTKSQASQGESMLAGLESQKEHCKPATINDNLFALPKNITFYNLNSMMNVTGTGAPIDYQKYLQNMPSLPVQH